MSRLISTSTSSVAPQWPRRRADAPQQCLNILPPDSHPADLLLTSLLRSGDTAESMPSFSPGGHIAWLAMQHPKSPAQSL